VNSIFNILQKITANQGIKGFFKADIQNQASNLENLICSALHVNPILHGK